MQDLIERLARALFPHIVYGTDFSEVPVDEAFSRVRYSFLPSLCRKAAIAALETMREPTEKMIVAGCRHENIGDMAGRYKAMIDEALKARSADRG